MFLIKFINILSCILISITYWIYNKGGKKGKSKRNANNPLYFYNITKGKKGKSKVYQKS